MKIQTKKTNELVRYSFTMNNGGSVKITIFAEGETKMLVGYTNPKRTGFFKNLNNETEVKKEIEGIKEIIWLSKGEQYAIAEVLKKGL